MPQRKMHLTVDPPLAGVSKRAGFQKQPPFTGHTITDFWPVDVDSGRAVLATRPELTAIGSPGDTVNMLARVNGVKSDGPKQSMIAASGSDLFWWDDTVWRLATGAQASAVDTGRAVFACDFLSQAFIFVDDAKPIVFDYPTAVASTLVEQAGDCPASVRFGTEWQGGLWVAGQEDNPHILFGSRTGNAFDWDFSADIEDEGGAFFDLGGYWSGPITALVRHTTDTLLISTVSGMVAYHGHPRRGGTPEVLSSTYILGQGAWTKTPGDRVYMLTPRGLMYLDPNPGAIPIPISDKSIPEDLIGLTYDYADPKVNVCYDSRWNCIHITDRTAGATQAWSYFLDTGAFVKNTLANYPYVLMEFPPFVTATTSGVLFGRSS